MIILNVDQCALKWVDSSIANKLVQPFGKAIWPFGYMYHKPLKWILFLIQ